MTIQEAILMLAKMKDAHGDIPVFFDCPHCGKSTQIDTLVAVAMAQKNSPS